MIEFLAMDGYAGFVWGAYAVTGLTAAALIWWTLSARAHARARLERIQARNARDSRDPQTDLPHGDAPHASDTGHAL